jgi:hypothetical protein
MLGPLDTGFAREPNSVYHGSIIQAGVSNRQTYYGLIMFDTPMGDDLRVLSVELVLTAATKSPRNEGVITAGLLPSEITEHWQTVTYAEIDEAQGTPLDSPIVMSSLHTGVTQGDENRFSVSDSDLASFEDQLRRGRGFPHGTRYSPLRKPSGMEKPQAHREICRKSSRKYGL